MGLRPLEIFQIFQRGGRHYASESDVYWRQILTYNDGPRAERVKLNNRTFSLNYLGHVISDYQTNWSMHVCSTGLFFELLHNLSPLIISYLQKIALQV